MAAHPIIESYFGGMRARDIDCLVALFAEDGLMILPDGRELPGPGAIRAMYTGLFAAAAPTPTPLNAIASGDQVAVEIEARMGDGAARRTCNVFTLDGAGRIKRLSIYMRG